MRHLACDLNDDRPNSQKIASKSVGALAWYAIHVRTNAEATVQTALVQKGYETFLPTCVEVRRYSDRIKRIQAALFPGYLFCRLAPDVHVPVLVTSGVFGVVSRGSAATAIPDDEIEQIKQVTDSGISTTPWPYLRIGDRVKVIAGAMDGIEGCLVKARSQDRLVLSVHLLQRSISFEINRHWIRPVV